jgi:hypothetical protein
MQCAFYGGSRCEAADVPQVACLSRLEGASA